MYSPPDRPLVVKCTFDNSNKKITFNSARNCSYDVLRRKVEECFSLYATAYAITWKDDDGEVMTINTDHDFIEAMQYFHIGDDAPTSSGASVLSGRSFGSRRITVRVTIVVEYDGPSLSDTSSLASLDEFRNRNGSQQSFSFGAPSVEDDSVTVSSRDAGGKYPFQNFAGSARAGTTPHTSSDNLKASTSTVLQEWDPISDLGGRRTESSRSTSWSLVRDNEYENAETRYPANPVAVFERLKMEESLQDDASSISQNHLTNNERGAAWLREQNERAFLMLGPLPEQSDSDAQSLSLDSQGESLPGDLALECDEHGRYYYKYTSGSSVSQFQGSLDDDGQYIEERQDDSERPRPTSLQLKWLKSQQLGPVSDDRSKRSSTQTRSDTIPEEPVKTVSVPETIDEDFLTYLNITPSPESLTDCSNCGVLLETIRYVCATCGEKGPHEPIDAKGKGKDGGDPFAYPPSPSQTLYSPSSATTQVGTSRSQDALWQHREVLPSTSPFSTLSLPSLFTASYSRKNLPSPPTSSVSTPVCSGYELCPSCVEVVGIRHAIEAGIAGPGSLPALTGNHDDPQRALQWRRAPPKKGQLRHAFREKLWGPTGWSDVEQDEERVCECSTCGAVTPQKRYKCLSCPNMQLCRACYSQVHELHPSHVFLLVPDKRVITPPSVEMSEEMPDQPDEQSLTHPGVKCAHCLLDIVGARFHCAICDSVDICSNCESAGLPGNLDSADGGHDSSHILIKIPYPLERTELQSASRRALHLWTGRDAASVGLPIPRSRANSDISSYAQTMVGNPRDRSGAEGHRMFCGSCNNLIVGIRFQCGHCPSTTTNFSLCAACEPKSYLVHDPMHIFFKIPRPVNRPLESPFPMLPPLYKVPAGPPPSAPQSLDPKAYLYDIVHNSAICDRCMTAIQGEWFRCCYCPRDLCDSCAEVDTHAENHIFLVFKSVVDMLAFKSFAQPENPNGGPPVISYPIYR